MRWRTEPASKQSWVRGPVTLPLAFDGGTRFQVFNFTGYEVWELTFPGIGTAYSTYAIES